MTVSPVAMRRSFELKKVVADLDLARAVAGVPERRGRDGDQRGEERGGSYQASQATQSRVAQKAFEALLQ